MKVKGLAKPVYKNIYLIDSETAGRLFLDDAPYTTGEEVAFHKIQEPGAVRTITIGSQKVAEEPEDNDFEQAAVYTIDIPQQRDGLLCINYYGDVARLYDGDRLLDDNFYNGREFQYALWRLPKDCSQLQLRILPLQPNMPVYFPREANIQEAGEKVNRIYLLNQK